MACADNCVVGFLHIMGALLGVQNAGMPFAPSLARFNRQPTLAATMTAIAAAHRLLGNGNGLGHLRPTSPAKAITRPADSLRHLSLCSNGIGDAGCVHFDARLVLLPRVLRSLVPRTHQAPAAVANTPRGAWLLHLIPCIAPCVSFAVSCRRAQE
jgi:hypothetical protein